ncbi:hypothetical protein FRB90_000587 [Tulasnella sp. 427]|nr:hypothetical protein FRB90_000587 [Tulasnella sp. 427]
MSHSINQNLAWPDQVSGKKAEFSATTWTVVERFGTVGANAELLNDPDIHRVENVLTMSGSARQAFDTLEFWFEATDAPNTYNIRKTHEMHNGPIYPPLPPQVTLSSTDPSIPLPNPNYLSIHAACAKVAHLSGAREYLETILEEEEETRVLASNGGSADMLSFLLARAAVAGH